jgi:hypothetical protein
MSVKVERTEHFGFGEKAATHYFLWTNDSLQSLVKGKDLEPSSVIPKLFIQLF